MGRYLVQDQSTRVHEIDESALPFWDRPGYTVIGPVPNVEQAQQLINEEGLDAALLDVRLGSEDRSFDFAQRLHALRIPFAFVTGYSRALMPLAFRDAECLGKPLSREQIAAILSRLLAGNARNGG